MSRHLNRWRCNRHGGWDTDHDGECGVRATAGSVHRREMGHCRMIFEPVGDKERFQREFLYGGYTQAEFYKRSEE